MSCVECRQGDAVTERERYADKEKERKIEAERCIEEERMKEGESKGYNLAEQAIK